MKKLLFFALLLLGFSALAIAQDIPRGEVFLGYSHFGCDNTVFGSSPKLNCTYDGVDLSLVVNANKWVGFVSDFGANYNRDAPAVLYNPPTSYKGTRDHYHAYTFLFGPKFTYRNSSRYTPFIQMLFGDARVSPGTANWPYENAWATAFGGGLDIKATKNFSFRPIQLEYMAIKLGKPYSDNIRYSIGLTYKFGAVPK
jgi:hypothetical protein